MRVWFYKRSLWMSGHPTVNSYSIGTLKIRLGIHGEGGLTSDKKWPCRTELFGSEVSCLFLAGSTCYQHNLMWFEIEKQYCHIN